MAAALPTRDRAADAFASLLGIIEGRGEPSESPPANSAPLPAAKGAGVKGATSSGKAAAAQERLTGMRNYVARCLVAAYGRRGAAHFCRTYLAPARWHELRRACFLHKPVSYTHLTLPTICSV